MTSASGSLLRQTESSQPQRARSRDRETIEDGAFGARMAAYLGRDDGRAVSAQTLLNNRNAVTGLRCDGGLTDLSAPIPAE
jgi:hypothetical protein